MPSVGVVQATAGGPDLLQLLGSILPLILVAMMRPVQLVQASAVTTEHGEWAGSVLVFTQTLPYLLLGGAAMGVLGGVAATWAERQIASNVVDAILGMLLLVYGVYELSRFRRREPVPESQSLTEPNSEDDEPHVEAGATVTGLVAYGLIGSPTNLTDIPFVIAIGQRIGSSPTAPGLKAVIFLFAITLIMLPGWLPILLARRVNGWHRFMSRFSRVLTTVNRVVTVMACTGGACFLFYLALT